MKPVDDEADEVSIVVDASNEADSEDGTNKENVAGTHSKQRPCHLDIPALKFPPSFLNSEISLETKLRQKTVLMNSYELFFRKLEDLMLVLQMVK